MLKKRIIFVFILVLVLASCTSLKNPAIKCIILDSKTHALISNALVYIKWQKLVSGPGGRTGGKIVKEMRLETKDGQFTIPERRICNFLPYPFGQGGILILKIYAHGYKTENYSFDNTEEIYHFESGDQKRILLERIDNADLYSSQLTGLSPSEIGCDYIIADTKYFLRTYPRSRWADYHEQDLRRLLNEKAR